MESSSANAPETPERRFLDDTGEQWEKVRLRDAFWVWLRVAVLSVGGPAAQIAVMHRIIVDEKHWLTERRFLQSLNFCMLLPGPEAQQLATYIGWLINGIRGGLMAGLLFILPGFVSILILSVLYVTFQDSLTLQSLFFGLKCAVLAVIAEAVMRVGRRVLQTRGMVIVSVIAFLLLSLRLLPFPAVIGFAAAAGVTGHWLRVRTSPRSACADDRSSAKGPAAVTGHNGRKSLRAELSRSVLVSVICLSLWFAPIAGAVAVFGPDSVFVKSSVFFSKAAVVTFGGAYSVLSYVDQQAVEKYQWLEKGEMADGLGLAETTPGPLIMVVQFVGFLAAWRYGTVLSPIPAGILGAILTTWVTFVPCFFWIFLGAPYIERLLRKQWLSAALTVITSAVVGVIATLGFNLALTTLFADHRIVSFGLGRVTVPVWSTLQPDALLISALAFMLTFVFRRGLAFTLLACVIAGIVARVVF